MTGLIPIGTRQGARRAAWGAMRRKTLHEDQGKVCCKQLEQSAKKQIAEVLCLIHGVVARDFFLLSLSRNLTMMLVRTRVAREVWTNNGDCLGQLALPLRDGLGGPWTACVAAHKLAELLSARTSACPPYT